MHLKLRVYDGGDMDGSAPSATRLFTSLRRPVPSAGLNAYRNERELALQFSPRRRENYERYMASARRDAEVDYLPLTLDIENVSRCNFRCVMCLMNDIENGKRANDMTLSEYKQLIDEQYGLLEIKLHGLGEPLLQGEDFFEMIRYARAQHIWVRTVTNGSLLHVRENYKKLIDSGINEVQISVDGATKETYERIRRNGKFERTTENCRLINAYCRELGITRTKMWTVVQRDNVDELEGIVELASRGGFEHLVFSLQCYAWGSPELYTRNTEANAENLYDFDRLERLMERGDELGVRVSFWNITSKFSADSPEHLCPWVFERAYIGSDSTIMPCSHLGMPEICQLGKGQKLIDAWLSDEYRAFRQAHINGCPPDVCKRCYVASPSTNEPTRTL